MVLENQTFSRTRAEFVKEVGCTEAGAAATYRYQIVDFARILRLQARGIVESSVANLVRGCDYIPGIAVGVSIIADASIAGPRGVPILRGGRRGEKGGSGTGQGAIDEVATRHCVGPGQKAESQAFWTRAATIWMVPTL